MRIGTDCRRLVNRYVRMPWPIHNWRSWKEYIRGEFMNASVLPMVK
jgi:hypothetical protein